MFSDEKRAVATLTKKEAKKYRWAKEGEQVKGWQAMEVLLSRIEDPVKQQGARMAVKNMLGKVGMGMKNWERQANSWMLTLNIMTYLTMATVASFPDLAGTILRSKGTVPLKDFVKTWKGYFTNREAARKFARELGVDINQVAGSQKDGRVVEDDIKKFVSSNSKNKVVVKDSKPDKIKNEFEHSDFGEIEIKDIPRVKKLSSKYLTNSWTTIPHVTNHDEADITEMESFRSSLTDMYTGEKIKITPLAFIIKALVASLKKFPSFNSSIDEIEIGKMKFFDLDQK